MKKFLLLTVCVFFTLAINAQPMLQYPQNALEVGDAVDIQFVVPNGLDPMPMGANVSWDYSQLINAGAPGQISAISPSAAPSGNEFPEANVVLNMNDTIYTYIKADANMVEYLGTKATFFEFDALLIFNDYKKYMDYPFPFGAFYTDTYSGVSSVMTAEIRLTASTSVMYDAYGTLVLPNGTFENVIRTKSTDIEIDSILVNGFLIKTVSVIRDRYNWHTQDGFNPIFSMEIQEVNGMKDTVCYYTTSTSGIGNPGTLQMTELRTYPNPAEEYLNVSFTSGCQGPVRINIANQVGQNMVEHLITQNAYGQVTERIDISKLPAGIYFVSVLCSDLRQLTGKFIIK